MRVVVQDDIAGGKFSFVVIDNSGQPAFQVRAGAGEGGTVELRLVTPEDVGAAVLKTLKATAEHHLGQGVTQVGDLPSSTSVFSTSH